MKGRPMKDKMHGIPTRCGRALARLALFAALPLWSAEVTPDQALTAVENWVSLSPRRMESRFSSETAESMATVRSDTGRAVYHAVNFEGGGFVVTAGDTRITPIIAFSATGRYSGEEASPLHAFLLQSLSGAVSSLERADRLDAAAPGTAGDGAKTSPRSQVQAKAMDEWSYLLSSKAAENSRNGLSSGSGSQRESIGDVRVGPLLQTQWGQWGAWVGETPYYMFDYYTPQHFVCGCAATAAGQIMKYWEMPKASIAQFSNVCSAEGVEGHYNSMEGKFDWNNMFLTWEWNPYGDPSDPQSCGIPSETQRKAVGKLTYNIGVALGMQWGSGGSTAVDGTRKTVAALKEKFGYAYGTCIFYDINALNATEESNSSDINERLADFNNALYGSLDAKMPVLISIKGKNSNGGVLEHAIVADGYGYVSGKRYTHLNFGWEGDEDAWYCIADESIRFDDNAGVEENYWRFVALGFNINPNYEGDVISGRVLDSSGNPVPDATVRVDFSSTLGTRQWTVSSDSKGIYWVRVDEPGTYTLKATSGSAESSARAVECSRLSSENTYSEYERGARSCNRWGVDLSLGSYTVTYKPGAYGSGSQQTATKLKDVALTLLGAIFTRAGYTQTGWATSDGGGKAYNLGASFTQNGSITFYPYWSQNAASTSSVTFDSNGGVFSGANFGSMDGKSGTATVTLTYGKGSYNSGMRATKSGATFQGWWTATSGGSMQYDANGKFVPNSTCWDADGKWKHSGNAKFYARWTTAADSHTLTFDSNGGKFSGANFGSMDGKSGTAIVKVSCGKGSYGSGMRAAWDGYAFKGWWTAKSGGSMQYDANGKFVPGSTCWDASGKWKHHGNAALYARWEAVSSGEPHTLKFDSNGGVFSGANFGTMNGKSGVAQVSVTCGKGAYSSGMRATKSGATFNGWWTAASGGSMQYDANGKYVGGGHCWTSDGKWHHHGNAMLYARWIETCGTTHAVAFDPNGGVLSGANFGAANGTSSKAQVSVMCGKGSYNSGMKATNGSKPFLGWWTAVTGGSQIYDANGKFIPNSTCWTADGKWKHHGNATLYARWTVQDEPHGLAFNSNGGVFKGANFGDMDGKSGTKQVSVTCGKSAYATGMQATKSGATFKGWWTAPTTGGSMQYDANGKFVPNSTCWDADGKWKHHGNATLYARWQ